MDNQPIDQTTDRDCPVGFVVVPAFLGGLVWLYALLAHMMQ